jgi:hypothetical protein
MMTLKQAVEIGIQMGMTTFTVKHFNYSGKLSEQTADTIFDFIKGYEDDVVITCYFGTYYSDSLPSVRYGRPEHCHLVYRLENEKLPN